MSSRDALPREPRKKGSGEELRALSCRAPRTQRSLLSAARIVSSPWPDGRQFKHNDSPHKHAFLARRARAARLMATLRAARETRATLLNKYHHLRSSRRPIASADRFVPAEQPAGQPSSRQKERTGEHLFCWKLARLYKLAPCELRARDKFPPCEFLISS